MGFSQFSFVMGWLVVGFSMMCSNSSIEKKKRIIVWYLVYLGFKVQGKCNVGGLSKVMDGNVVGVGG